MEKITMYIGILATSTCQKGPPFGAASGYMVILATITHQKGPRSNYLSRIQQSEATCFMPTIGFS
jgi:hypothetical protein